MELDKLSKLCKTTLERENAPIKKGYFKTQI